MAWAHLAARSHCHGTSTPAAVMDMPADCHEHAAGARAHAQHGAELPCCADGGCVCATPPAPMSLHVPAIPDARHDTLRARASPTTVSPDPLDDTLRPPIG